jgi:hypothetical protein
MGYSALNSALVVRTSLQESECPQIALAPPFVKPPEWPTFLQALQHLISTVKNIIFTSPYLS